MSMGAATTETDAVKLRRRNEELEQRLAEARRELAAARERLDHLAAEQSAALAALHKAERRRGSLAYRVVAEVRARLRGSQ
jgi:predicted  nucleic acid-binding Zn-ribbon protein